MAASPAGRRYSSSVVGQPPQPAEAETIAEQGADATVKGQRIKVWRTSTARFLRGNDEVVGHIHPMSLERVAKVRIDAKLAEAARARRIAEARVRTDRRGLRSMWRRRITA